MGGGSVMAGGGG